MKANSASFPDHVLMLSISLSLHGNTFEKELWVFCLDVCVSPSRVDLLQSGFYSSEMSRVHRPRTACCSLHKPVLMHSRVRPSAGNAPPRPSLYSSTLSLSTAGKSSPLPFLWPRPQHSEVPR